MNTIAYKFGSRGQTALQVYPRTKYIPATCKRMPKLSLPTMAIAAPPSPSHYTVSGNGRNVSTTLQPPQITVQVPDPIPALLPPAAAYENVAKAGAAKASLPAWKTFFMGIVAGCFVSFGGLCAVSISGLGAGNPVLQKVLMGIVFPFGLLMITICGAELYTGNTAVLAVAAYEKKASLGQVAKNWCCSYLGNFVGSLLMVALVAASGLLASHPMPVAMAVAKSSLPWTQAFVRAVLCNWLVCAAVWMASASTTLPGKALGSWIPVTAFIIMGLEHCVANMWGIPMGILLGAPVSVAQFVVNNLVPVTLGNTLGGVLCMATVYAISYGALGKPAVAAVRAPAQ